MAAIVGVKCLTWKHCHDERHEIDTNVALAHSSYRIVECIIVSRVGWNGFREASKLLLAMVQHIKPLLNAVDLSLLR